jgi:hypothetical protein
MTRRGERRDWKEKNKERNAERRGIRWRFRGGEQVERRR